MNKRFAAAAAVCLMAGVQLIPAPSFAADSPDDIAALMMDGTNSFKKGLSALDDAERHWKLGNSSQTCDSLSEAYNAFTHAWQDKERVKSDVIDQGLLTGEAASVAREWIDTMETQAGPIGDKMRTYGTRC